MFATLDQATYIEYADESVRWECLANQGFKKAIMSAKAVSHTSFRIVRRRTYYGNILQPDIISLTTSILDIALVEIYTCAKSQASPDQTYAPNQRHTNQLNRIDSFLLVRLFPNLSCHNFHFQYNYF